MCRIEHGVHRERASERAQSKVGKAAACMRAVRKMVLFSSRGVFTKNYTKYDKNRYKSLNVVFILLIT